MAGLLLDESVIVFSELMIVAAPELIKNWSVKGSHLKNLYQSV
jgi:hypothetical protein